MCIRDSLPDAHLRYAKVDERWMNTLSMEAIETGIDLSLIHILILKLTNQIFPLSHKNNASINTGSVSFCICVPSPYLGSVDFYLALLLLSLSSFHRRLLLYKYAMPADCHSYRNR